MNPSLSQTISTNYSQWFLQYATSTTKRQSWVTDNTAERCTHLWITHSMCARMCVCVPLDSLVCVCDCMSMCVWVIIFDNTDGHQTIVCVCVLFVSHIIWLCRRYSLFSTNWSEVCVCVCVFWVSASLCPTFLLPVSLPVVHTHTLFTHSNTHTYTLSLTGSRGNSASGRPFCTQWVWLCRSDPDLDLNIKI